MKGPLNFLTLSYVETLIRLQLESRKTQRKGLFKRNKVLPTSILKVNVVDELTENAKINGEEAKISDEEAKIEDEEEFFQTRGQDSDQENAIETVITAGQQTIILNLSHVTWMDVAGCEVISWMADQYDLFGVVVESPLEVCSS